MTITRQKDLGIRRHGESSGKFAAAGHDEAPDLPAAEGSTFDAEGFGYFVHRGIWRRQCPRCGGKGNLREYRGILGGVCFKCAGSGVSSAWGVDNLDDVEKDARTRRAARDRYQEKKETARLESLAARDASNAAARARWADENPDLHAKASEFLARFGFTVEQFQNVYEPEPWLDYDDDGVPVSLIDRALTRDEETALSLAQAAFTSGLTPAQGGYLATALKSADQHHHRTLTSRYLGEPDDKVHDLAATVVYEKWDSDSDFPSRYIIFDVEGNTVVAYTTAAWAEDVRRGDRVTLAGTVKKTFESTGVKKTQLTRIKGVIAPRPDAINGQDSADWSER